MQLLMYPFCTLGILRSAIWGSIISGLRALCLSASTVSFLRASLAQRHPVGSAFPVLWRRGTGGAGGTGCTGGPGGNVLVLHVSILGFDLPLITGRHKNERELAKVGQTLTSARWYYMRLGDLLTFGS